MGKGSSGSKTTYTQSPEQRQMYAMLLPMIEQMAGLGTNQLGQPGYGMPQAPTMPSMSGVLSGVSPYSLPNAKNLMPTKSWWNSLAPGIKEGAWAPFEEGKQNLLETMGNSGMASSARGGYSGAAGAALGEYMADATPAYAMNLWNMSSPGMFTNYASELDRNQRMWSNALQERGTDYQNQMNQLNQNYQGAMNAWALPWGLTGMMPNTFSQGITTQPQNNMMGALGGAGGGAATGAMIGSIFPGVGTGLGALLGGGAGLFGGMGGK
jgi:hypothetical protein